MLTNVTAFCLPLVFPLRSSKITSSMFSSTLIRFLKLCLIVWMQCIVEFYSLPSRRWRMKYVQISGTCKPVLRLTLISSGPLSQTKDYQSSCWAVNVIFKVEIRQYRVWLSKYEQTLNFRFIWTEITLSFLTFFGREEQEVKAKYGTGQAQCIVSVF